MNLPRDYATASAADGSGSSIPAGGYVCQIKAARPETTNSGSEMLSVMFDIFEGEYTGHYQKQFAAAKAAGKDTRWRGTYNVFTMTKDGRTNPFFKGLITAVEKSNPNAVLVQNGVLNEGAMKNCIVGLLFREEEFLTQEGTVRTTTRPSMAVEARRIREGDYTTPAPRKLAKTAGFTELPPMPGADDDLPF